MQAVVGAGSDRFGAESANWVGAWGVAPERGDFPAVVRQSFRMIVHPTIEGEAIRLRFSNEFGDRPLLLSSVSVARRLHGPAIDPATSVPVRFDGGRSVVVAPHERALSDPVELRYDFGDDLAVTFFVPGRAPEVTGHHGFAAGVVTSYATAPGAGDTTADPTGATFERTTPDKYFLTGVDSYVPAALGTVVAFGDSITDGTGSTTDGYDTWPDVLARRLHAAGVKLGVVNAGIGGNTVLPCATPPVAGEAAVERFERDALDQPNVRVVVLNQGGNDLRFCPTDSADVAAGLQRLADRSRRAGVAVVMTTYVPHVARAALGSAPEADQAGEGERQALNRWILHNAGWFDGVVDFDAVVRDPADPSRQRPESASFDGVHPGPAGLRLMAEAVPVHLLEQLATSPGRLSGVAAG
jgi:lysophospholipase L1-like esterase